MSIGYAMRSKAQGFKGPDSDSCGDDTRLL